MENITLGEIASYINGRAFKPSEWEEEGLPIIRIQNLNNDSKPYNYSNGVYDDKYLIKEGNLLFAWSASLGVYIRDQQDAWLNQHIFKVVPFDGVNKLFLRYLLENKIHDFYARSHGTGMVHITSKEFKKTPVWIPSTKTQQRIVSEIEKQFARIDAGVDALRIIEQKLKDYKASLLKSAVEGKLTAQRREQNPDVQSASELLQDILKARREKREMDKIEEFKAKGKRPQKNEKWKEKYKEAQRFSEQELARLSKLPQGRIYCNIEQLVQFEKNALKAGPFGSSLKKSFYTKSGYKIYGQEQVINNDYQYGDYYISEEKYKELYSCRVKPGDLLISLVGTVGKVLILPVGSEPGIINPRLIKVSFNNEILLPRFYKYFLFSLTAKAFLKELANGTTMDVINMSILKSLPVPVPSIEEQLEIIGVIENRQSIIDTISGTVQILLTKANHLKQSILQKAYSGELVPQLDEDGDVEELLEQIKQAKADYEAGLKAKKKKK